MVEARGDLCEVVLMQLKLDFVDHLDFSFFQQSQMGFQRYSAAGVG